MDFPTFIRLVRAMRQAQKNYLRDRTPQSLAVSKDAERRVDAALDELSEQTKPALFGQD